MFVSHTKRPRNLKWYHAAAILYGDLGTSKAYVLGLAFVVAGYSSSWLIFLVSILTLLIGLNYLIICKCYPEGGGAYSSVRKRSHVLSLIGAFFLIADYFVTASLSSLAAFDYLGVMEPAYWAMGALALIGFLNFLGPKHTGNVASFVAVVTMAAVVALGFFTLPHLGTALQNLKPLSFNFQADWKEFVSIIVALSGIEAIANTTGLMKLDPGSTLSKPSVMRTARPAILIVVTEVAFFTALFGLAMLALPDLQTHDHEVSAPGYPNVRDAMLRYMGEVFVGQATTPLIGHAFSILIAIAFGILLLSAANTAIVALVSLLYVMATDKELPERFLKLNAFGVPLIPLIIASAIPIFLLIHVQDIVGLADLYAVGFVGAIATNLGSTATDKDLKLTIPQRTLMLITFAIMLAIEVTLFIDKPHARNFIIYLLAGGLLIRSLTSEQREKQLALQSQNAKSYSVSRAEEISSSQGGASLCAVMYPGKALEFALRESKHSGQSLYVLYVREQRVITEEDLKRRWEDDPEACEVFDFAEHFRKGVTMQFVYVISDDPAASIIETAGKLSTQRIILGMPRERKLLQMIRGNIVRDVVQIIPPEIDLVVIS